MLRFSDKKIDTEKSTMTLRLKIPENFTLCVKPNLSM
jgi:hypothetical protein